MLIGCPTAVTLASFTKGEAENWQKILTGNNFRVYTSDDDVGLEVGGATKNIYAVAAGISKAMKLGDNALAAIACRGSAGDNEVRKVGGRSHDPLARGRRRPDGHLLQHALKEPGSAWRSEAASRSTRRRKNWDRWQRVHIP